MAAIEHITITCNDLPRCKEFYDLLMEKLGMRRFLEQNVVVGYIAPNGFRFFISQADDDPKNKTFDSYSAGLHHLSFKAESRQQVDELGEFLKANGVEIIEGPKLYPHYDKNYYAVFFRDPNGIKLEMTHLPFE